MRMHLTYSVFESKPPVNDFPSSRSGADNFWHGMITGVYHLYLSLRVSGLSSYDGRRIAYVNGDSPPTLQALGDVYKAYGPHVEWADYTTIPDRRCFRSLSVMRTGWTLRYPNFDTMNEDPTTLDFADYIAEGLGLSGGRAALPPVPRVYYLHRGNSHRRIANYRELLGAMPKRVEVTTHNVSAMSFRDQVRITAPLFCATLCREPVFSCITFRCDAAEFLQGQ